MRRTVATVTISALLAGGLLSATVTAASGTEHDDFTDIAGTTHELAIRAIAEAGVVAGYPDGTFRPADGVTRGQMATFLADGFDLPEDDTIRFIDAAGTTHEPGINAVASAGITAGVASYTDAAGDTVLEGVALADDGTVLGDERRTIYTHPQPFSNHNGGQVKVGPEGLVYLGLGDGGGSGDPNGNGQDLTTALGSIIRIDPDAGDPYGVPADNPFVEVAGAAEEIFAYGLRNPWRFSFDRETDVLWIADVGQGQREEANRVPLDTAHGANFGWNLMEGTLEFTGSAPDDHVPPIYEYDTHGPEGCAVTGGYVYTGTAIPELRGAYLYADFCNGEVRGLVVDPAGEVVGQGSLGVDGGQVVSFAEDADGELYVLDLGGQVSRLGPA